MVKIFAAKKNLIVFDGLNVQSEAAKSVYVSQTI